MNGQESSAHLPEPSIWPPALGLGITLLLFGLITSLVFTAVGAVLLAWSVAGWIGELRHESTGHE